MTKENMNITVSPMTVPSEKTGAVLRRLTLIMRAFGFAAAGFFFCAAELPFQARILGVSLVCAVSRGAPFVLLGIVGRSVTEYIFAQDSLALTPLTLKSGPITLDGNIKIAIKDVDNKTNLTKEQQKIIEEIIEKTENV